MTFNKLTKLENQELEDFFLLSHFLVKVHLNP